MLALTKKHIASVIPAAVGAAAVMAALLWYAQFSALRQPEEQIYTISGVATRVVVEQQALTLKVKTGQEFLVALLPETRILDENGDATVLSYIKTGFTVSITVSFDDEQMLVPFEVKVLKKK